MNLAVGIVGLANVGKSTLFNALLKKQVAQSANYPFTTIEPNVGVVEVPDERLEKLAEIIARDSSPALQGQNDKRAWVNGKPPIVPAVVDPSTSLRTSRPPVIIPAVVQFVDIAGLVKGAHKGEGLGNQFLSHIREVDVIVFLLRDFKNEEIIKTGESPKEDLEVLKDELLLKDLETVEKRLSFAKATEEQARYRELLDNVKKLIEQGKWLADELNNEELAKISDLQLLSAKKTIVVENSDEGELKNPASIVKALRICAKLEEELAGLSQDEQKQYLGEIGVVESGLEKLIKKAYETLDLSTFLTAGPKEVRAWTLRRGSTALRASGIIHSDFERGFIAADIVPYDKFVEAGGWQAAREKGLVKTVGKSEEIKDGLVVEFKFSV